jgi:hypothetical protein
LGALAAVDMDLETLAINVGALQGQGCMEPEAHAIDGGKGDWVVERGGGRPESPTASTLRTAGRWWVVGARRSASVDQSRWRTC